MKKKTEIGKRAALPALPKSWSGLTWRQLCDCWACKMRYGRNADVARVAALLQVLSPQTHPRPLPSGRGEGWRVEPYGYDPVTGEKRWLLTSRGNRDVQRTVGAMVRGGKHGEQWVCTPRELAHMAKEALPWFDYPYGDPGEPAERDEKGKVIREARNGVRGYVNPDFRDALMLPEETVKVGLRRFALPQVACNSLTWQQYRSLQAITPQLFQEGLSEEEALDLQAQFLAHCLVPRSLALLDTAGGSIKLRPHYVYQYNSERAEGLVKFWKKTLSPLSRKGEGFAPLKWLRRSHPFITGGDGAVLFHICLQCYQTALMYYAAAYPLLFADDGKKDAMQDALQGEVGTINAVMMKAGYTEQQQVYDSNLPFILDILNTMTKEAKQIEQMNAKIKKK